MSISQKKSGLIFFHTNLKTSIEGLISIPPENIKRLGFYVFWDIEIRPLDQVSYKGNPLWQSIEKWANLLFMQLVSFYTP